MPERRDRTHYDYEEGENGDWERFEEVAWKMGVRVEERQGESWRRSYFATEGVIFKHKVVHVGTEEMEDEGEEGQARVVTAGLHELGHADAETPDDYMTNPWDTIACEEEAWDKAQDISRRKRLPFDEEVRDEALESYYGWGGA